MYRASVPAQTDKEVFSRTAAHTKAINLGAKIFRGGTRL